LKRATTGQDFDLNTVVYRNTDKQWHAFGLDMGANAFYSKSYRLDSQTDSSASTPKDESLWGSAVNGSQLVVVGETDGGDAAIYLDAGAGFVEKANAKSVDLFSVAYSSALGMYAAVGGADGTNAYILTSTDGSTWTERDGGTKNFTLYGVCWDPVLALFVAVGVADGSNAYILTSANGTSWTERDGGTKNIDLYAVASDGNGTLIAVGGGDGTDAYILKSTNGTSWTEQANPVDNVSLRAVAYFCEMWVAVGVTSASTAVAPGHFLTSLDGETWTSRYPYPLAAIGGTGADLYGLHVRDTDGSQQLVVVGENIGGSGLLLYTDAVPLS
jgi:hypothetical protein